MRKVKMAFGAGLLSILLTACGIKKYMPEGPVTDEAGRAEILSGNAASGVVYRSPPAVTFPVLPLQVWGVTYDLDLVLVSSHPRYNMHEYARIKTVDGDLWLAKDALEDGLTQSLIADIDDINGWVPELPIVRQQQELKVVDRSADGWLDLDIAYTNLEGEAVKIHYEGKEPAKEQSKRNGSTMGHSASVIMAALDISHKDFAKRASVEIDGQDYKIQKLLGLVGLKVALKQTQGGLSTASFTLASAAADDVVFTALYDTADGLKEMTDWSFERGGRSIRIKQVSDFRTLQYNFRVGEGAVELMSMDVHQFAYDTPATHIEIRPALPDMRRKFGGVHTSRFVVDINGQETHAVGRLEAWWDGDVAKVKMIPEAPEWTTDRPMLTSITYVDGQAITTIERIPVEVEE